MRRRVFTIAAGASAVVFLVAVLFWVNSFRLEYYPGGTLGFRWHPTHATPQLQCAWLVAGAAGVVFGWLAIRSERELKRRFRLGLCLGCGYDLRGSTSARCTE